jgi:hypothetical protein
MPWKFDAFAGDVVWVQPTATIVDDVGDIDMGDLESDLVIDLGSREDSPSQIDQGMRVYDGDI